MSSSRDQLPRGARCTDTVNLRSFDATGRVRVQDIGIVLFRLKVFIEIGSNSIDFMKHEGEEGAA
jgi:putative heme iron utilization protein